MGAFAILSLIAAALPIVQQLEQLIVGARRGQVKKDSAVKNHHGRAGHRAPAGRDE